MIYKNGEIKQLFINFWIDPEYFYKNMHDLQFQNVQMLTKTNWKPDLMYHHNKMLGNKI